MRIKNKKITITGGAGFIGSNLVERLINDNEVIVIDNFSVGNKRNLSNCFSNRNLKIIRADILDKKNMMLITKNSDFIVHMATQCVRKSINDPLLVHEVNASGTLNMLEAAKTNGIKKFIYISSSEIYGTALSVPMKEEHPFNPTTVYGASKLVGELYSLAYLKTYNFPTIIVRPFNTYGYNSHFEGSYGEVIPRFIVRILNNLSPQIFGGGQQTRDFTFVTDTVDGIVKVLEKGKIGEIYNIARGEEVSINQIAKIIMKILNKKLPIEYLEARPGDVKRHYSDITKVKRELNFSPKVNIEDGLKEYIKWFQKNIKDPKKALKFYEEKNW